MTACASLAWSLMVFAWILSARQSFRKTEPADVLTKDTVKRRIRLDVRHPDVLEACRELDLDVDSDADELILGLGCFEARLLMRSRARTRHSYFEVDGGGGGENPLRSLTVLGSPWK